MMGSNRRIWALFVRHFAGESSEREDAEIQALLAVDEDRGQLFDELRRVWKHAEFADDNLDVEKAWKELDRRLQDGAKITSLARVRPPVSRRPTSAGHRSTRRTGIARSAMWVAAVLAAVLIGTIVAVDLTVDPRSTVDEPDYQVFATKKGERSTVRLSDGSRVLMNADSRLTVPAEFARGDRLVQFEGQGYFQVVRTEGRSFVVRTQLADVEVLGTEFDLHAYPESEQLQVVVTTGEVSVRSNQRQDAERIVLRPHDLGLVLLSGGQLVRRDVDLNRLIAWRDGRLVFDNASFEEVAAKLDRWYDLDVRTNRPTNRVDGLTVTFYDESADEVLDVISAALNLSYRRDGRVVTFYANH